MNISEKTIGDTYIIELSGRMDTINSRNLEIRLNEVLEGDKAKIVIDLAAVDYISSVGLRVLLATLKKQIKNRRSLRIASLQPFVKEIFNVTGFDRIFSIYSSQEEAIKSTF